MGNRSHRSLPRTRFQVIAVAFQFGARDGLDQLCGQGNTLTKKLFQQFLNIILPDQALTAFIMYKILALKCGARQPFSGSMMIIAVSLCFSNSRV